MCDWTSCLSTQSPYVDPSGCWHGYPMGTWCDHRQSSNFRTSPESIPLSEAWAISNTVDMFKGAARKSWDHPRQESTTHVFYPRGCWERCEASMLPSPCSSLHVFPRSESSFCELAPLSPLIFAASALPHHGLCHHRHKVRHPTNRSGRRNKAFGSCALKLLEVTRIQVGNETLLQPVFVNPLRTLPPSSQRR